MEIQTILNELEFYTPKFPRRALQEAIKQHSQIIPILLETLKGWLDGDVKDLVGEDYYLHLYAFFLLAQFREKQAYPLIIDFVIEAEETIEELLGDTLTEDFGRIIASVYDGDFAPLKRLIYDQKAYEYARSAGITALVVLYAQNIISREEILQHFESLFQYLFNKANNEDNEDFLITHLVGGCLDIVAIELTDQIHQAFEKGLVDPMYVDLKGAEKSLEQSIEQALSELREQRIYCLVKDSVAEMEWWACFADQTEIEKEEIKKIEKLFVIPTHKPDKKEEQTSFTVPAFNSTKKKAKQKQQKLSRKKNRSKKK